MYPIVDAGVPKRMPIFLTGTNSDDPEKAAENTLRRLVLLEDTLNRVCRAFNGIHAREGGDLHIYANIGGDIEFAVDRPLGEGGAGDGTSLPWYSSTDGVTIQCNGGLVLRMRGKNGYVYTDLADTSGVISVPTDGNNVAVGVSVDVSTLATCTATWTSAASLNALLGLMDADTAIWPVVLWNNTGGVYTKTIYHIGGALVLPMYG